MAARQAEQVMEDASRGPVGVYPAYCEHKEVVRYDLRPIGMSWSGLDIKVTNAGADRDTKEQPFLVRGKKLVTATISAPDGTLLYTLRQKWASFKTHYYAKDAQGNVVLNVRANKALMFNLTATFTNAASGVNEERQFELKTGATVETSELREGNNLLATIKRPERFRKMWMLNEHYELTVSPNVDRSLVLAICVCMHTQLLTYKTSTLSASSASAASVAV